MRWVIGYLVIGLLLAVISYYLQRNNPRLKYTKRVVGSFAIIVVYALLFPIGLASDLFNLILRGSRG